MLFKTAQQIFQKIQRQNCTMVREVESYPLNRIDGLRRAIKVAGDNVAIWQHGWDYHVAAIKIKKGTGFNYNRQIYNLYQSGIKTLPAFKKAWFKTNKTLKGQGNIPTIKANYASDERKTQKSFIVAENPPTTVHGKIHLVDRTHLIPFSVTGIEYHKGLLIDFDSVLNRGPMNTFEQENLKLSNMQDIIWATIVFITNKDHLAIKEMAFNTNYQLINYKTVIDMQHSYLWYI